MTRAQGWVVILLLAVFTGVVSYDIYARRRLASYDEILKGAEAANMLRMECSVNPRGRWWKEECARYRVAEER